MNRKYECQYVEVLNICCLLDLTSVKEIFGKDNVVLDYSGQWLQADGYIRYKNIKVYFELDGSRMRQFGGVVHIKDFEKI